MVNKPVGIDALAGRAADELLHGDGPDVLQVVGAGVGDDAVPDDGLVRGVGRRPVRAGGGGGPLGRHVDKHLLRVPREEAREVGVEAELDDGVLLLLAAVVVRTAADAGNEGND